jgi:hypothetical protein
MQAASTCVPAVTSGPTGGLLRRAGTGPSGGLLASLSSRIQMQRRLRGWTEKLESSNIRHPFKAVPSTVVFETLGGGFEPVIDLHNYSIWFWFPNRLPSRLLYRNLVSFLLPKKICSVFFSKIQSRYFSFNILRFLMFVKYHDIFLYHYLIVEKCMGIWKYKLIFFNWKLKNQYNIF